MKKIKEEEFTINKGIQMPGRKGSLRYPFDEMDVGDSFIIGEYSISLMAKYSNAPKSWVRRMNNGRKFAVRKVDDNKVRIWRTK